MKEKLIFLFPGQGAQYPGMGLDFLREKGEGKREEVIGDREQVIGNKEQFKLIRIKELFDLASELLKRDMRALLRDTSSDELKRTDIAQPAITLVNLAAAAYLAENGIKASACAGFSLGEYAAFALSGIISEADCFFLVDERGKAMQTAVDKINSPQPQDGSAVTPNSKPQFGMAAIIGLAPEKAEALTLEIPQLYAANINSPKQIVVSGSAAALEEAEKHFKAAGALRVIRLSVAGPFHSPFMKDAAEAFAPALEKVQFNDPVIPVFSNVTGKQIKSGSEAKSLALRQITEGVRWTDIEASIALLEPSALLETGPGKVLQGLWKDTGSRTPCYPAGNKDEIDKLGGFY